jgi:hypothetical protein
MKCFHLRWVRHLLNDIQKANRVDYAQEMFRVLDNNAWTGFKYPVTANESWIHSDQSCTQMWALYRESVDSRVRWTDYQWKTMITVFLGIDAIALLSILLQDWTLTSKYFQENSIWALAVENHQLSRKIGTPRPSFISRMHPSTTPTSAFEKPRGK